ncbi:Zinc finger protein 57 [Leucoagaricus sp. SymC.cos]|nr:Zinc finger protein 57 [Leucoagaricus sp. SymC.cos]
MHSTHRDATIDSLRRNPADGAYHCPRCDAPFTRRSNLRRHYHIHTRNMVHKCQACNQVFAKSEELQSHSMQCGSTTAWEQSTDRMIQAMTHYTADGGIQHNIEFAGGLGIVGTPIHEHPPAIPEDFINVDLFQQADPLKSHEQSTQEFHDFFSSISSALSEGATSPSTSSEMMSTTGYFPYPAQRSGSTSSNVGSTCIHLSVKNSPSPPAVFPTGPYISPEERANSIAQWNKYNMMVSSLEKPSSPDKPTYSRKQVEDMLDMVGNCFLNTIDAVLQRTQAGDLPLGKEIVGLQTLTGSHGSSLGVEARRMVLVETIPRLMASLQTLRDDGFGTANQHPIPP